MNFASPCNQDQGRGDGGTYWDIVLIVYRRDGFNLVTFEIDNTTLKSAETLKSLG